MIKELKPIRLNKYSGRNAFSEITNLGPTEFRSITNYDIYSGTNGDYLKVRRGSKRIGAEKLPDEAIINKVVFPTPAGEFAIYNTKDPFTAQHIWAQLLPDGAPYLVMGGLFEFIGDDGEFLSQLQLNGVNESNSDNLVLYWTLAYAMDVATLTIFKDSDMMEEVATGTLDVSGGPDIMTISESNSSGITGTVYVESGSNESGTIQYSDFEVAPEADSNPCDMKVYNDRVYVFNQNGNKILYYDASQERIIGREMGLEAPIPTGYQTHSDFGDMVIGSTYTYGLEAVRIVNGADIVASSPRRVFSDNTTPVIDGSEGAIGIYVDPDIFLDQEWTHIRLWRSKNQTPDFTDPLYPIDAQGTPDQLWEVALITRNELLSPSVEPVDTGGDLPPGNTNVSAGFNGFFYEIIDGNDDSVLLRVIGLDLIGLIPFPGCRTGVVNKGRIWGSGIGDDFLAPTAPNIDPVIREDWLYTTELQSQYQEQWDAQAYLDAGRDGKKTESLQVLLEDIIGFRENMTKRVASGNPNSLVQMLDDKIGVNSFRMTGFIPGIGICAICSDGYFRYLGFDQQWHQYLGKTEISQSIYDLTVQATIFSSSDFVYMNGKLIMRIDGNLCAALGVKENKGWSTYSYPEARPDVVGAAFNFGNGQYAATAKNSEFLRQIEIDSIVDENVADEDAPDVVVTGTFETYGISGEGGLLEVKSYSFWGKLASVPTITAKSSNLTWGLRSGFINPGLFSATTALNEREYLFEPKPVDITPFKWIPLRGQFVSFVVSTIAPAMISWQQVKAIIRPTNGNLGVYPAGGLIPQGPGWNNQDLMLWNFEDLSDTFFDASGKGIDLTWAGVGAKSNRVEQKPGFGVLMASGGYAERETDTVSPLIGMKNLSFKTVFSLTDGSDYVVSGKDGDNFFILTITPTYAQMIVSTPDATVSFTSTFDFQPATVYVLTFALSKAYTGQFYFDELNASSFFGARTTVKAPISGDVPVPFGDSAPDFSNLVLGGSYANQPLFGTLWQTTQFWKLYESEVDRDAETNPVGFFAGPPVVGNTYAFTAQNGSGITGTVDWDGSPLPEMPENLDVVTSYPPPVDGIKFLIGGVVSYYEVIQSPLEAEQAKRFWGIMKAY